MERPMMVLWSRSAAVTLLVVRGNELHDERRDPVLHLGERQGIDDLVADAVEVLAAEMRLALDVGLAGDVPHHGSVDLPEVDEAALEAELTRLLDDQADAAGRGRLHADDVRLLGEDPEQQRVEIGHGALEELLAHDLVAELL